MLSRAEVTAVTQASPASLLQAILPTLISYMAQKTDSDMRKQVKWGQTVWDGDGKLLINMSDRET